MRIKNKITTAVKSKEGKVLIDNFASLFVLQVVGYLFPLITLPYLAHTIGVSKFGEIAFAGSIIIYFSTLIDFGFNYTATRDIARNRDDIDEVSKIFSNVMTARLFLFVIGLIALSALVFSVPYLYERRLIIFCTASLIPGTLLFPEWFFQAMEKMRYITVLNVIAKFIFTVLVFVVIRDEADYFWQPILTGLGFLCSGIAAIVIIFVQFKVRFRLCSWHETKETLKGSYDLFLAQLFPNLYTNLPTAILNVVGGNISSGLYSSGSNFVDISNRFTKLISRTFYPFLARRMDKHNLFVKINLISSFIVSAGLFIFAGLIIRIFYAPEFIPAVLVLRIRAITPFLLCLGDTYGTNYLVLVDKERTLRNILIYSSVIGCAISFVGIYYFDYIGLAVAITLTLAGIGAANMYYATKYKK